jgi:hypothetical protein
MGFMVIFVPSNQNIMARKNYSGSDLSPQFKSFARKEFKRLTSILTKKGCTSIEFSYGFYYFSGFFTSPSGQVYYMSCSDTRHQRYEQLLIRTARDYKDFSGGSNNYIGTSDESLMNLNLK